jgi:hypothetical protein
LASFGHGSSGRIWWSYNIADGNYRSVVAGIPGYQVSRPQLVDKIDLAGLAKLDYDGCPVVVEFYHCHTADWYGVDDDGVIQSGDAPRQESIIS